jgi:hypothetical protein
LAQFIRGDAESEVRNVLGELGEGLIVHGRSGQGNWAIVPWIAVFDPAVTWGGYYTNDTEMSFQFQLRVRYEKVPCIVK